MKKRICHLALTFALMLAWMPFVLGQDYNLKEMPPIDPKLRCGVLQNGMHYYIYANRIPEKRGEFYLANNIGAIQENDDQNGLAHFTEHMAFNGTDHFPKKGILDYLATIGVKFGTNVNASTGVEQTVFNMSNVPLSRQGIIDSCLMILRDWSHYISFEDPEIDLERGVIVEEWRMYGTASERMSNKLAPLIYKGSKYALRNVIGDTAVLKHFRYQTIRDFYKTWYRPDLQALILVGDFDADTLEAKIKSMFEGIQGPAHEIAKEIYPLPGNQEPLIGTATDKEATNTVVRVSFKHDAIKDSDKNLGYMRLQIIRQFIGMMLGQRLNELARSANPPFLMAMANYGRMTSSKDAFNGFAQSSDNETLKALNALLTEMQRMRLYGFTRSEFERVKADLLRNIESRYMDRDKRKNRELIRPILSNFLTSTPNPGVEYDYRFTKNQISGISLEEINAEAESYVTDNEMIVTITGPEKAGVTLPTSGEILNVIASCKSAKIEPYNERLSSNKLLEKDPVPGKIVNMADNSAVGTKEWVLSNGIRVIFKPTDIREDELIINGYSEGGTSLLNDEDLVAGNFLGDFLSAMGAGNFSRVDLTKILAGKRVSVNLFVSDEQAMVSSRTSPKDLESALQLIWLNLTSPRWDEADYKNWFDKTKANLVNADMDPRKAFTDTTEVMVASHNKRIRPVTVRSLDQVSPDRFRKVFNDCYGNPGNFTFLFTGKINPDEVKPWIEKYLASLPAPGKKNIYIDRGIRPPAGKVKRDFTRISTTPRTSIYVNYHGHCGYTEDNRVMAAALRHVLELRYIQRIREDEGGAYSVRVSIASHKRPVESFSFVVMFETDPLKADKLLGIVHGEIARIIKEGPSSAELQKFKEYALKQRPEDMKENNWWNSMLTEYYFNRLDNINNYEAKVKAVDLKSLQDFAKQLLGQNNVVEVIMRP